MEEFVGSLFCSFYLNILSLYVICIIAKYLFAPSFKTSNGYNAVKVLTIT